MSFASQAREEIARRSLQKDCCVRAAAYGFACFAKYFDAKGLVLQTEQALTAQVAEQLFARCGVQGTITEKIRPSGRTAENRLYLSSSNEWNCPQTEKAYLWFFEKLTGFMGTEMRLDATLSAIRQGGSEKSRILHEMLYADLGIKDIRITGSKEEPIISALHILDAEDGASEGFWLPLGQESVGTQRFFSRIGMWLAALESGSVLVVDEIESSMHPLLTRHLIEMVQDDAINTNHAQLIFTTHDTGLLDLTLLRRDQIWFAEKNEKTMQTDIYALTEFSPRKGENIAKGYLQGRYGAIPHVRKELLKSV